MRESNSGGSKMVGLKTQLNNFIIREARATTNGVKQRQQLHRFNRSWLRIVRNGNNFQGYFSTDGANWHFAMSTNILLSECIEIGMFAESINNAAETVAVFGNVSYSDNQFMLQPSQVGLNTFQQEEFSIYPNPGFGQFYVQNHSLIHEATLQVFDSFGNRVMNRKLQPGMQDEIQINSAPGLYLFNFISEDGSQITKKILNK